MIDGWLNLAKFLTSQFGLPGSIMVGLVIYLAYVLKAEREDHKETRKEIGVLQDKRLELHTLYIKSINDLKEALHAVAAAVDKR